MPGPISVHDLDLATVSLGRSTGRDQRLADLVRARRTHWLVRGPFGVIVSAYDDVVAVLRDKRWHSVAGLVTQLAGIDDAESGSGRRQTILSVEGEVHTRLRRLVAPAFSPRAADRLRPAMRAVMNDLIDAVADAGRCDVVTAICEPYPIPIICELLGAPASDWQLFSRWATDLLRVFNATVVEEFPLVLAASRELDAYSSALIEQRRRSPADDLITALIAANEAGDRLSHDELLSMVNAVIVGGTDTTRNQLACAVAVLSEHPDQWRALGHHPELAGRAVEETMRYLGAVRATMRIASEDITYRDVVFPAGTLVSVILAAANRDDAVWDDPERFDITRPASRAPQLSFGAGIHSCLGAWLARAELQEALPLLARRLPDLAVEGTITWKPDTTAIWGPEHLPVSFTAAP